VELQESLRAKDHTRGRSCGDDHALAFHPDELELVEKIFPGRLLMVKGAEGLHQQLENFSKLGDEGPEALMDDKNRHVEFL
jgi:hypothetical protein